MNYHLHVQIISRADGRSAVAAAAYRAGVKLIEERTGELHDFTRKRGVVFSEISLPDSAPERFHDRSQLWNEVEAVEKSARGQLAREVEFSLPVELPRDEQIDLARDFVEDEFVARGMVADWSIHDNGDGNPHCHCMLTMRNVEEDGFLPKAQKEYFCRNKEGEEGWYTASELKEENRDDPTLEKVYTYKNGEELTKAEAEERGLGNSDRKSKYPISAKRETNDWNDRERVDEWRKSWEEHHNDAMARWYDRQQTPDENRRYVDCRSLAEQGIDRAPQIHEGAARAIEDRVRAALDHFSGDVHADRGDRRLAEGEDVVIREPITERAANNADIKELEIVSSRWRELADEIRERADEIREALGRLPARFRDIFQGAAARIGLAEEPASIRDEAVQHMGELLGKAEELEEGQDDDSREQLMVRAEELVYVAAEADDLADRAEGRGWEGELEWAHGEIDRLVGDVWSRLYDCEKYELNERNGWEHDDDLDAPQHILVQEEEDLSEFTMSQLREIEEENRWVDEIRDR